jgi:hypothetical protein
VAVLRRHVALRWPHNEGSILLCKQTVCALEQYVRQSTKEAPELLRIPLPRTRVNNANSSDRISQDAIGRTHRAGRMAAKESAPCP